MDEMCGWMKCVDETFGCVWKKRNVDATTRRNYTTVFCRINLDYVRVFAIAPRSQNKTRCNVEKWCMQNQILQKRWGKQMCMDEMCGCNYKTKLRYG